MREAKAKAIVRYCPVRDAFEATDKQIAVIGTLADGKAEFLRAYSRGITLIALDDPAACSQGVSFEIVPQLPRVSQQMMLRRQLSFNPLHPERLTEFMSQPAASRKLGARFGTLIVDQKQCTSVPGLYAAGEWCRTCTSCVLPKRMAPLPRPLFIGSCRAIPDKAQTGGLPIHPQT